MAPVLPTLAAQVQSFLQLESFDFESRQQSVAHEIAQFQPLMQRVDPKAVAAMVDASKDFSCCVKRQSGKEKREESREEART
ncbi:MAG: hypothetical protein U1F28_05075 [Acinetobacter sp.]